MRSFATDLGWLVGSFHIRALLENVKLNLVLDLSRCIPVKSAPPDFRSAKARILWITYPGTATIFIERDSIPSHPRKTSSCLK